MRTIVLCLVLLAAPALAEPPKVAATIPPLHSLVAMVTEGVTTPALLVPGDASPHDHALRPSEARKLAEADVVVWMGEALETPLVRPIANLAGEAIVLTLLDLHGQDLLPPPGAVNEHDGHDDGHDRDHGHDHGDGQADPHAWLDPLLAIGWVDAISETLSIHDPENAGGYRANADRAAEVLRALSASLEDRLSPATGRDYAVLHDAYRYFERRFGLSRAVAVKATDAADPGARHIADTLNTLAALHRPCLFAEPQDDRALAERLAAESGARLAAIDPLGRDLVPGPGLYPALLETMADAILTCLNE